VCISFALRKRKLRFFLLKLIHSGALPLMLQISYSDVMERKPKPNPQDDPEQSKRFIEGAREAGADETDKGAERAFKAVVKPRKSS
jgi:hypothetical protein